MRLSDWILYMGIKCVQCIKPVFVLLQNANYREHFFFPLNFLLFKALASKNGS